jgi:hypothetical protein
MRPAIIDRIFVFMEATANIWVSNSLTDPTNL